jgi:DNA-binding CsgD family transcriptional regulator
MAPPRARPGLAHLSPRQRETLALLAQGASVAETARALVLSPETVKTHRRALYRRLGVAGRVAAVVVLFEARLAAAVGAGGERG